MEMNYQCQTNRKNLNALIYLKDALKKKKKCLYIMYI